jgi:hypothetical protein
MRRGIRDPTTVCRRGLPRLARGGGTWHRWNGDGRFNPMWVGGGHLFEAGGFFFAFLCGFETGGAVGVDGAFSKDVGSSAGCGRALGLGSNYLLHCVDTTYQRIELPILSYCRPQKYCQLI